MTDQSSGAVRSYRQGEWFGIFGDRVTILLPPGEKARVGRLWELVDDGAGFEEVLDALVGAGLSNLPGFVLVTADEDPTRVVVRGDARATFVSAAGDSAEVDGTAASTWVERSLPGVAAMQILLGAAGSEDLPLGSGLVRVGQVHQPPYSPPVEAVADTGGSHAPGAGDPPLSTAEPADATEPVDSAESPAEAPGEPVSPPLPEQHPAHEAAELEEPVLAPPTAKHAATVPQPEPTAPPVPQPVPPPVPQPVPNPVPSPDPTPVPGPEPQPEPAVDDDAEPWFPFEPDHDGHTVAGGYDPAKVAQRQHGVPGQQEAPSVTAAPVARLVFSSGEAVDVDRAVLVGRAPETRRFTSTEQPRLVTVPSPQQEISSTHLEIRPGAGVDHGTAVVTDMGSTNGTVVALPGLGPEDLQPGIAVQLVPGAVIDLGDGVTIKVTNP